MKFSLTYKELKAAEKSVYSQGGQDGVLEAIFNQIDNGTKRFLDIGARDGVEISNTANLRLNYGWDGLLVDTNPLSENVRLLYVTPSNINELCSEEPDFINIDIDGNDYWVWEAMHYNPKVVCIEYNSKFHNIESCAIKYNPNHIWEGDDYYGASLLALQKLGKKKGYALVYVVDRFDAVFVRNDLIDENYLPPTLDELLPEPIIAHETISKNKWVIV